MFSATAIYLGCLTAISTMAYLFGQTRGYDKRTKEEAQENEFWKELEKRGLL